MGTTWGQLNGKLIVQAKEKRIPVAGTFELTARCNLRCRMCYLCRAANDKPALERELSAREWIRLAEEAGNAGVLYLLLTGGEVFLRKDFREIYEAIFQMGFSIQIYTNGTLVTPEIMRWLSRVPPFRVGVTLYGASPETYARVCGDAGGFDRAVRGIESLIAEGIPVQIRTTVIRDNINDFDWIAGFARAHGVELGITDYITPRREGCGTFPELERLTPEELFDFQQRISGLLKPAAEPSSKTRLKDCVSEEAFSCGAGKCSLWITWDGRMIPCGDMNEPVALPLKNGFASSWKEIREGCSSIAACKDCLQCEYRDFCFTCPARLKSETGHYDRPAPYLCGFARLGLFNKALKSGPEQGVKG